MRSRYLKSHPFVFSFALSCVLTGLAILLIPEARTQSLSLTTLPVWIAYCYAALSVGGGGFAVYGLWTLSPRFEGAGTSALAATQLFSLVASIAALGFQAALLGVILRGGLATGLIVRSIVLARQQ